MGCFVSMSGAKWRLRLRAVGVSKGSVSSFCEGNLQGFDDLGESLCLLYWGIVGCWCVEAHLGSACLGETRWALGMAASVMEMVVLTRVGDGLELKVHVFLDSNELMEWLLWVVLRLDALVEYVSLAEVDAGLMGRFDWCSIWVAGCWIHWVAGYWIDWVRSVRSRLLWLLLAIGVKPLVLRWFPVDSQGYTCLGDLMAIKLLRKIMVSGLAKEELLDLKGASGSNSSIRAASYWLFQMELNLEYQMGVREDFTIFPNLQEAETEADIEEEELAESAEEEIVKQKAPVQSKQKKATSVSDSESEESNDSDSNKDDETLKKKEIVKGKKPIFPTESKSSSEEAEEGEEVSKSNDDVKEVSFPKTQKKAAVSAAEKKEKFRAISTRAILPGKIMDAQWLERNELSWLKTTLEQQK
ncbi:hypothetical protein Droror1_Dr00017328 [Drosera rotundifolia]